VFNSPKADCSRSYLLATPPVAEQMSCPAALLAACSTLAPVSYTFRSPLAAGPSPHSVTESPKNEGFISQDHIGGFSMNRECTNTDI
jgi:hypothetical protein